MRKQKSLTPYFSAIFFDFFGFAILLSFLPLIFSGEKNAPFAQYDSSFRYFLFGAFLSTFAFFQWIGNLFFSRVVREENCRFFLMLSYLGNFCGYLVCVSALYFHLPFFLYLGNAVAGFLSTNMSGTQSSIAYFAEKEKKLQGFTMANLCVGLAFLSGSAVFYLVQPYIEKETIALWIVFLGAGFFSLLSAITVWKLLPKEKIIIRWEETMLTNVFSLDKREKYLYWSAFCFSCGWSIFIKFLHPHLLENKIISVKTSSPVLTFFSVGVIMAQLFLLKKVSLKEKSLFKALLGCGTCIFLISFCTNYFLIAFLTIVLSSIYALVQSLFPYYISVMYEKGDQGRSLSLYQSSQSIGKVIAPLLGGVMMYSFKAAPFSLGAIGVLCSFLFLLFLERAALSTAIARQK